MKKNECKIGPIFIVGMNGSGTTMLADCLNNHPNIFVPRFESKIIPFYYSNIEAYGDLAMRDNFEKLLADFSNTHIFLKLNEIPGPTKIPCDFEQLGNKSLSGVIDLTFSYYAKKHGKNIWGDHSPKYAVCLKMLADLFPNGKIVHIIRDVRDCALSFHRRFRQNMARSAFQWKNIVRTARKDGCSLGPKRYFEIMYEDLTTDPEPRMRSLFDFLELPFDRNVLKSNMPMFQRKRVKNEKAGAIVPNTGKWKSRLSPLQIGKIESIAGKTLKEFNYEIVSAAGDENIQPLRLACMQMTDKINSAWIFFKNDKSEKRFANLLELAKSSVKQMRYFKY